LYAQDLKVGAAMIAGGGIGALVGWVAFPDDPYIISCGVIGCVVSQFAAKWWIRRNVHK